MMLNKFLFENDETGENQKLELVRNFSEQKAFYCSSKRIPPTNCILI